MQFGQLKRRDVVALIAGAGATLPLAVHAQQVSKLPTIGYLGSTTAAVASLWTSAFLRRLQELGWVEGRTVAVEYRWAEGRADRAAEIAAEFVRLKVDVILTSGTTNIDAAKRATSSTPIIFAVAGDPVATGLVASLARPGGNATGMSLQTTEFLEKRLELLREAVPDVRQLAIMADSAFPEAVLEMRKVEALATALDLKVAKAEIRTTEDIASAFEGLKGTADALYVCGGPLMATNRVRISTLTASARLPAIYDARVYVEAGGMMSYGADFPELYRRAAELVDKVLRGAKPENIPVEQPTKFDLAINLVTARALGLSISPILLARADEVIE
jgi:putative ABC transport system substrate-binding protein